MAETMEYCFVFNYSVGSYVESVLKGKVSSYNGLINALESMPKDNKQFISHLCPFNKETNQADTNTRITSENGDEWVSDCKGQACDTHFTVVFKESDDIEVKVSDRFVAKLAAKHNLAEYNLASYADDSDQERY